MNAAPPRSASPSAITPPKSLESRDLISTEEIIAIIRANLVILCGLPFIFGIGALYYGLSQDKIYSATALVQLDPRPSRPLGRSEDIYDPGYNSNEYYGTQLQILESRKLAEQLTQRLNLIDVEEFGGSGFRSPPWWEKALALIPGTPDASPPEPIPEASRLESTIRRVAAATQSSLAPNTTLFRVQFLSRDPQLAAIGANALADLYIEELLQARLDIYSKASNWLLSKLGNVQGDLNRAETDLQSFRDERNIVKVGGNRGLIESEVADLTRLLRDAENKRKQLENMFAEIQRITRRDASLTEAQPLLLDATIKDTAGQVLRAATKVSELEQRYGTRHPEYLAAKSQLESLEDSYREQLTNKSRSLQAQLQSARNSESQIRRDKLEADKKLRALDRDEFELNMLERNVRNNQQLYDLFLARLQETESNSSFAESNARIADPAVPPRAPFAPQIKQLLLVGVALGALLATMLVLLRELLRSRIDTPEELEQICSAPLLGVVPHMRAKKLHDHVIEQVVQDSRSNYADSIRSIKTAVLIRSNRQPTEAICLALTSTEPSEGKTTLTAALAAVFSSNARVLALDTDLRRPRLAQLFGAGKGRLSGLAEYLQGEIELDAILRTNEQTGIHYIPSGRPPSNPAVLLESPRFAQLLADMRKRYDVILIDTPPLLAASDAMHLIASVDGFLVITRAHKTHRNAFLSSMKRMETAHAPCLGIILNDAAITRPSYGGYYNSIKKY